VKLNLGCGQRKEEGYVNVDIVKTEATDQIVDLFEFPWPWECNSVEEIFAAHFFEHVPAKIRFEFMDECYRVLIPDGIIRFIIPYWSSLGAIQDPTHEWPPICETSFAYFDKQWRDGMKLNHYPVVCDFEAKVAFEEFDQSAIKWAHLTDDEAVKIVRHNLNVVNTMHVELRKRGL